MEKRYYMLRFLAAKLKILGIFGLIMAITISLATCLAAYSASNQSLSIERFFLFYTAFLVFIYGNVTSLMMYIFGEGIFVFLAIEENTRATSLLMNRLLRQLKE